MSPEANEHFPMVHHVKAASPPGSPASSSSLSTQALLDLGFCTENFPWCSPDQESARGTHDRRSIDTLFALRFYSFDDCHHPETPIAKLPATPPPEPTFAPPPPPVTRPGPGPLVPPTPPLSTSPGPIPAGTPATHRPTPSKRAQGQKQTTYLNPAGEPWVSVPPPSIPLPAPPAPKGTSPKPRPLYSLFPSPPKTSPRPPNSMSTPKLQIPSPAPTPAATPISSPTSQNQSQPARLVKKNFSRPSPIAVPAPASLLPPAPNAPGPVPTSAPLPSGSCGHGYTRSVDSTLNTHSGGTTTRPRAGSQPSLGPSLDGYSNSIPHHHHHHQQPPRQSYHKKSRSAVAISDDHGREYDQGRASTPKFNPNLSLGENSARNLQDLGNGLGLGLGLGLQVPNSTITIPVSTTTRTTNPNNQDQSKVRGQQKQLPPLPLLICSPPAAKSPKMTMPSTTTQSPTLYFPPPPNQPGGTSPTSPASSKSGSSKWGRKSSFGSFKFLGLGFGSSSPTSLLKSTGLRSA